MIYQFPRIIKIWSNKRVLIFFSSKWMNGVGVNLKNPEALEKIQSLSCVKEIEEIQAHPSTSEKSKINRLKTIELNENLVKPTESSKLTYKENYQPTDLDYGFSEHQIKMLNGDQLHEQGFLGDGMTIAVLDNGFLKVNEIAVFDSLWIKNQIISTYDFVKNTAIEFNEGSHGTKVLSVMAANSPGNLMGTAPNANYHLIRIEIADSESLLEEYLWMCGAEYADSVGADIINSSLGYTVFDDASKNHTYSDLDGNTTVVARAADMAASKGILVVTSAGNYGNKDWVHIGSPSDGDSVLAVGAVDEFKNLAPFSSIGPTADGRLKPNIVAQGVRTAFIDIDGSFTYVNGTTFSSPLIAGLAACLWQNNPQLNNMQIIESIENSGSYASMPNEHYGYGIPNFDLAMQLAEELIIPVASDDLLIKLFPNPIRDHINLVLTVEESEPIQINILDINGKLIVSRTFTVQSGLNYIQLTRLSFIPSGIYILQLKNSLQNTFQKIIKLF